MEYHLWDLKLQVQPLVDSRGFCQSSPLLSFQWVFNVANPFVGEVCGFANDLVSVPSCSLQSLAGFSVGLWL